MYTEENLKEKYDELKQKIASTTITDEVFNEIESELLELEQKRGGCEKSSISFSCRSTGNV